MRQRSLVVLAASALAIGSLGVVQAQASPPRPGAAASGLTQTDLSKLIVVRQSTRVNSTIAAKGLSTIETQCGDEERALSAGLFLSGAGNVFLQSSFPEDDDPIKSGFQSGNQWAFVIRNTSVQADSFSATTFVTCMKLPSS